MILSFWKKNLNKPNKQHQKPELQKIKLVIVSFEDDCLHNSGQILAKYLSNNDMLEIIYYDEPFNKSFLDLKSRNFFDLTDTGNKILRKTNSDVLMWGYRKEKTIRLNFQTLNQYDKQYFPFFSLLNCLYLPLESLQSENLAQSLIELIYATILTVRKSEDYLPILRQTIAKINNSSPPKNLSIDCMPYISNLLALTYLNSVRKNLQISDIKIVSSILKNALNYQKKGNNSILNGLVYANLGQLYHLATDLSVAKKYVNCKFAIDFYLLSQKYFNRHTYPYDFAFTAYRLSKLYFAYWKYTGDIQSLRDAVFQLRESLKIFGKVVFPDIWAEIQNDLGLYLSMMAVFSKNDEIAKIAIENYKNYQQIYTKEFFPIQWATAQENIANIFFECGKIYNNEEYFEEAVKYYNLASEVYDEHNLGDKHSQTKVLILKIDEYLTKITQY